MTTDIQELRLAATSDVDLRTRLWSMTDREEFLAAALEIAGARDLQVSTADIEDLMREGRKEWLERWI